MKKGMFLLALIGIIFFGALGIVYQHNRIVRLLYERRRIEIKKENLIKQVSNLQIELSKLHDYTITRSVALNKFYMQPLKIDQMVTITQDCVI